MMTRLNSQHIMKSTFLEPCVRFLPTRFDAMFFPRTVDVGCVVVVLLAAECWLLVAGLAAGRNQPTPPVDTVC